MKLNADFYLYRDREDTVLVPAGGASFSGLVRGNRTLGVILELLEKDTTEEAIVAEIRARFDAPEDAVERDVSKTLEQLRAIGALDE